MARNASPTAIVPEAQLMLLVAFGPCAPNSMAMLQLDAPPKTLSASEGSTDLMPSVRKMPSCSSAKRMPPSALPIMTPTRSRSSAARSMPESSTAWRAHATEKELKRSSRFAFFASMKSSASKSLISAALRLRHIAGSNRVIVETAERSRRSPSHSPSRPNPMGVTAPIPVTATRLRSVTLFLQKYFDSVYQHMPDFRELYAGPVWEISLATPTWPHEDSSYLLESELGLQTLPIAVHHGHGKCHVAAAIGDRAVSRHLVELPVEFGRIPLLGMPHIRQAEIVLVGPEEGDGVEPLARAEDIARGGLPLTLGHHPVLHADALARQGVGPARDVAGREDALYARLEVLVHRDAPIDGEGCVFCLRGRRAHTDAGHDEVRRQPCSVLQRDAAIVDRRRGGADMERHAVPLVQGTDEAADLLAEDLQHRNRFRRDHVDGDIARAQRCRHFEPDETRADHDAPLRLVRRGDQCVGVGAGAQIMDVRPRGAWYFEADRFGAGGEQQSVITVACTVDEFHVTMSRIDRGHPGVQLQLDTVCLIESEISEWHALRGLGPREISLGKSGAVARHRRVGAQHRDASRIAKTPQHFCGGVARRSTAYDHDSRRKLGG